MGTIKFRVDEKSEAKLQGLNLGYMEFRTVKIQKKNPLVDQAVTAASKIVTEKYRGDTTKISEDPVVRGIRALFSKVGLDPTRDRPSGEALIRRIVGGQGIYRINSVVDTNNVISILTGCPCGVYDLGKIDGETITLAVGLMGQTYGGIGGRTLTAENRIVTLDSQSIFGGPTADSERTCITLDTNAVLMLIYHPATAPAEILASAMQDAKKQMERATGGREVDSGIFLVK